MDPIDLTRDKFSQDCEIDTVLHLLMAHFDLSEEEAKAKIDGYFKIEEQYMEPIDLIRDKFSQDCEIDTVLHLVMAHFDLSEEEAKAKIDEYFEIVEEYSELRNANFMAENILPYRGKIK